MATHPKGDRTVSLGPLEDEIMRIAWGRSQATVRDVQQELDRRGMRLAYTTVMTVMGRLATKGMLSRKRVGRPFSYRPRINEEQFRASSARTLARHLVGGYDGLGIASFVHEVAKLGPERLRELRELAGRASAENDGPR